MIGLFQVYIPSTFLPPSWITTIQGLGAGFAGQCIAPAPGMVAPNCNFQPSLLITTLLPNIIMIAGVFFFLLIMVGGWGVLSGAGNDQSAQDKAKSQAALTYGVVGFLLVISAYFILQVIETITGVKIITPNPAI